MFLLVVSHSSKNNLNMGTSQHYKAISSNIIPQEFEPYRPTNFEQSGRHKNSGRTSPPTLYWKLHYKVPGGRKSLMEI